MRLLYLIAAPLLASPLLAQANYISAPVQQPDLIQPTDGGTITTSYLISPDGQEGPIPNKPFSAIEVRHTKTIHPDRTYQDHIDTNQFYRDAQGRMRVQGSNVILIFDPTIDKTYTLHRKEKDYAASRAVYGNRAKPYPTAIAVLGETGYTGTLQTPGPVRQVTMRQTWGGYPGKVTPASHVETVQLGTQTIKGQLCTGTRVTLTIPAYADANKSELRVVNERWYSDDLQVLVKSTNNDPRFGVSTYELKDITRTEPDPSLFKLPADYTPAVDRH